MNRFSSVLFIAILAGSAHAQSAVPASVTADPAASELLEQVANNYQQAGALTDLVTIEIKSPSGTKEYTLELVFSGKDEGRVQWGGLTYQGVGGDLFIQRDSIPTKFIRKSTDGDFLVALLNETQGNFPVPHFALRQPGSH